MVSSTTLDYTKKLILAPMVRVSTLPMRLMSLKYGADLVYSPEIIDIRLIDSQRIVNEKLGTIDFVDDSGTLNLRVHPLESKKLIVQIGTANPENAIKAALKVCHDVAGIDVNCGCPLHFSIVNAMGSSLLKDPERLESILKGLVENVPLPISCKIRLLPPSENRDYIQNTIDFIKRMEQTGISAIGLHCRFVHEKPRNPGHQDVFREIYNHVSIPLIANGDFNSIQELDSYRKDMPNLSFMIARSALKNPTVFDSNGKSNILHVMKEYIQCCIDTDTPFYNCKYVMLQLKNEEMEKGFIRRKAIELREAIAKTKNYEEMMEMMEDVVLNYLSKKILF